MNVMIFDYDDIDDDTNDDIDYGHTQSGQPGTRQCRPVPHCCNH